MTCAVAGCGREIVRGPLGQWAHTANPGRDHHYARPVSQTAAHLTSAFGAPGEPGERLSGRPDRPPASPTAGVATTASG